MRHETTLRQFREFFHALWDSETEKRGPFPWQEMLASQIAETGRWPEVLQLPTASGKTAVIDIAVFLLAHQANRPPDQRAAPRRIWFVVDRRIVVDEAYSRAERIADKLKTAANGVLKETADNLRRMAGFTGDKGEPLHDAPALALARLRGGILQDDGWARLPSQPAVITSTVDQLGSRLLFRSYGGSNLSAPIHAALAGNDSLIILDEAHCAQPFLQTLRAVSRFRNPDNGLAKEPLKSPFAYTVMSATPPEEEKQPTAFPATPEEKQQALNHPILEKRMGMSKKAKLLGPLEEDALISEMIKQAKRFHGDNRQRIAIMVNRVATAIEIADKLQTETSISADIVVLTGRIRPIERDALVKKWAPYLQANSPETPTRPIILVTTQCLEVGADFSFDALITECASLDALRQRFGRLNRLGDLPPESTSACIVMRKPHDNKMPDPIYGEAINKTWEWLNENPSDPKTKKSPAIIDFGITALDDKLPTELSEFLAPTEDAPVLLPAHLDMLCQTSPQPDPEPEVSLFLHGKRKTVPEVCIIWRADLDESNSDTWTDTVALLPPSSSEAISVPLWKLCDWLEGKQTNSTEGSDVEGEEAPNEANGTSSIKFAPKLLVWRGPERSEVIDDPKKIPANAILVLPVPQDGMSKAFGQCGLIQGLGPHGLDLAELAHFQRKGQPVLRLVRSLWKTWITTPHVSELFDTLDNAADAVEAQEAWASFHAQTLLTTDNFLCSEIEKWIIEAIRKIGSTPSRLPEKHPADGWLVRGKATAKAVEQDDYFSEDADNSSAGAEPITIANHTADVIRTTNKLAQLCLPSHPDLISAEEAAARYHDIGKIDERWQFFIRNGDEPAVASESPLAKSLNVPTTPTRQHQLREDNELPRGFRHEMLSVQLTEALGLIAQSEINLSLHLIASHHGHARPFAPVVPDDSPPAIDMEPLGFPAKIPAEIRQGWTPSYRLDSGVPERFWQLTRRFGWWGLPYLESLLRLADWHASRYPIATKEKPFSVSIPSSQKATAQTLYANSLTLSGLEGSSPLGFLAACGVLRILSQSQEIKLTWEHQNDGTHPVLQSVNNLTKEDIIGILARSLRVGFHPEDKIQKAQTDALHQFEKARTQFREKQKEIKKRRLNPTEAKDVKEKELTPLRTEMESTRKLWLEKLEKAVPFAEMALGQKLDCLSDEFKNICSSLLQQPPHTVRTALDMLAHFGSDACFDSKSGRICPSPFSFINGSGHQFFLETAKQLVEKVSSNQIEQALFHPWAPVDETLSMRWMPIEDRRYALMADNPTAANNKPKTIWAANLLGYIGLGLFPSVPSQHGLFTTCFPKNRYFQWPIWTVPCDAQTIASLLQNPNIAHSCGVTTYYSSERIEVGGGINKKINFTPAKPAYA